MISQKRTFSFLAGGIFAAALALTAQAKLTWSSTEFSGATQPLQKTLSVAFAFKNTGTEPVEILEVQVNCDCMTASADKPVYQPGESGVIHATFTVGDRIGTYERGVSVVTNDGSRAQRLRVRIEVPELATVSPRVLEWPVGSAAAEKSVDVVVAPELSIAFSSVFVSAETFRARVETIEAGRRYRLFIQPVDAAEAASAAIRLQGQAATGEDVIVSAYANVH